MNHTSPALPIPRMTDRLRQLRQGGVAVGTVIDVGVQNGTPFLIDCFPDVPHLLFEPVQQYLESIRKRYATMRYELFDVAASSEAGQVWLLESSLDGSGRVTHSQIVDAPVEPGSKQGLVACRPVARVRLDDVLASRQDTLPYLLKLDVDGHEIPILHGAMQTMAKSSVVIVEASIGTLAAKVNLMQGIGFQLFDIVDLCYYHGVLSQVDLIFVHAEWVAKCPDLRPWQTKAFSWDAWISHSRHPSFDA